MLKKRSKKEKIDEKKSGEPWYNDYQERVNRGELVDAEGDMPLDPSVGATGNMGEHVAIKQYVEKSR